MKLLVLSYAMQYGYNLWIRGFDIKIFLVMNCSEEIKFRYIGTNELFSYLLFSLNTNSSMVIESLYLLQT